MVLSWKHVLEGVKDDSDNLNLALHEFGHALILETKVDSHDVYFGYHFSKIDSYIKKPEVFKRLSQNKYFREYAQSNRLEFYSVAIECFFETPLQFKEELPKLYQSFCLLLNNDPLQIYTNNIVNLSEINVRKETTLPKYKKEDFGYRKSYK